MKKVLLSCNAFSFEMHGLSSAVAVEEHLHVVMLHHAAMTRAFFVVLYFIKSHYDFLYQTYSNRETPSELSGMV